MTLQEALAQGMLPADRLAPVLRRALHEQFGENIYSAGAESWPRILKKWEDEVEWVEFDAADRAFAHFWLTPEVWMDELPDLYYAVALDARASRTRRCARSGCSNTIPARRDDGRGGRPRKFCSNRCLQADYRHRRGARPHRYGVCVNGHPRSKENTRIEKSSRGGTTKKCRRCAADYQERRRRALGIAKRTKMSPDQRRKRKNEQARERRKRQAAGVQ